MRESNSRDYPPAVLQPLIEYFSAEKIVALNRKRDCIVAEVDGAIVGTAALEGSELLTFFVEPKYQGRGIGEGLLRALESAAIRSGVRKLTVASSLTAVSFYAKMGFVKNGRDYEKSAGPQIGMEKKLDLWDPS